MNPRERIIGHVLKDIAFSGQTVLFMFDDGTSVDIEAKTVPDSFMSHLPTQEAHVNYDQTVSLFTSVTTQRVRERLE